MKIKTAVAVMALVPVAALAGEIHRWVDDNGQVHYGDKPPVAERVEKITVKPNVYVNPTVVKLAEDFAAPADVILYSTTWCNYCRKAREYFSTNGIAFREYDVEKNRKGRRDYKRMGAQGVPVILVGGKRLNGFSEAAFERLYTSD